MQCDSVLGKLSVSTSLHLIHKDTKISLFKFKGRGLARRADSLHHRTGETTDGHSSEGLLPHIRLASSGPPIPHSSHPPICIYPWSPSFSSSPWPPTVIPNLHHRRQQALSPPSFPFSTHYCVCSPLHISGNHNPHVLLQTLSPFSHHSSKPKPLNCPLLWNSSSTYSQVIPCTQYSHPPNPRYLSPSNSLPTSTRHHHKLFSSSGFTSS